MQVIILQVIFAVLTFVLTLLCMVLPARVIQTDPSKGTSHKTHRIMSFCNCVSGGVFLSTCFVGLIPFVREKFQDVFRLAQSKHPGYPFTECTVLLGFFLILLLEQTVLSWQQRKQDKEELQEMLKTPNEYVLASESSGNDESDSEPAELRRLAKPKHRPVPVVRNTSGHSHHSHGDQCNSHGANSHSHDTDAMGHGHAHLGDMLSRSFSLRVMIMLVALSVHAIFEGLAVGLQDDTTKLVNLYVAVIIHECLVSFAMGVSLAKQRMMMASVIKISVVVCVMIPIGMVGGVFIGFIKTVPGLIVSAILQGLAAGTFVYVVFLEILPGEINTGGDRMWKVFFLFIGTLIIAGLRVTSLFEGDSG